MSIEGKEITNYSQFNKNPWLIEFFKESNIIPILESSDRQFEDLENALFTMLLYVWLDDAVGEQLDVVGIHIGVIRNGRNDETYRTIIRAQIQINISSGEPEALISAIRVLFDTNIIEYHPMYPAKVRIWVGGNFPITDSYELVDDLGNNIVDDLGNFIILEVENLTSLSLLLGLIPSGVGLLFSDFIIDDIGNFIITDDGSYIVSTFFIE